MDKNTKTKRMGGLGGRVLSETDRVNNGMDLLSHADKRRIFSLPPMF